MTPEILTATRPRRLPARCAELPYDDERPGRLDDPPGLAAPPPPAGLEPATGHRPPAHRPVRTPGEHDPAAVRPDARAGGAAPGEPPDRSRSIPVQRHGTRSTGPSPTGPAAGDPRVVAGRPVDGRVVPSGPVPSRETSGRPATRAGDPPVRTVVAGRAGAAAAVRPGPDGRFAPTPGSAAAVVVRAIVEALSGIRPATQLACWTTPRLQADLERRIPRETRRSRDRWAIRSIRVSQPRPGVAEVSAVIIRSTRAAAVALRMESADGRWRVTTLQVG